jgi:hypothetical protein
VQAGGLDPVRYYISSMFTQVLVSSVTLIVAPLIDRTSAVSWLGSLGGVVIIKFLLILWAGILWRAMFCSQNRNPAEILVFTTHISATISLLWSPLPLIDLAVPMDLTQNEATVVGITLGIEVVYAAYAMNDWSQRSVVLAFAGFASVLSVGYSYRLIRSPQETSLRERFERKKESAIVSRAAYVGLFLAASLFLVLVVLLAYRATVPERRAPPAVPQESRWGVTRVSFPSRSPTRQSRCVAPTLVYVGRSF